MSFQLVCNPIHFKVVKFLSAKKSDLVINGKNNIYTYFGSRLNLKVRTFRTRADVY